MLCARARARLRQSRSVDTAKRPAWLAQPGIVRVVGPHAHGRAGAAAPREFLPVSAFLPGGGAARYSAVFAICAPHWHMFDDGAYASLSEPSS